MLDSSTESGRRAEQRLRQEPVIWLTTVKTDGQPQSSPIWFLWDNGTFLAHSKPDQKIRNIRQNPHVALHLNDHHGGDVVTIEGTAEILPGDSAANLKPTYLDKYREGIKQLGTTPEQIMADYPVAFRVTPTRIRTW
jgi:PPOX class probable F420-dependent enzyme